MSPRGALILAILVLILLGVLGLWLVNVPVWAAVGVGVLSATAAWRIGVRLAKRSDRAKTEA